jgi:4-carboxymuconolactone decarboxylase
MNLDEKGLATRRAVLGDAYVDAALAKATPFTAPLQELVTRHAWGNTWQRDGIDLRLRSIVTVSMLVALGRMHELKIHVRGALNNGVTTEELQEIFLHASVYCGFPAAVDAFRHAAGGGRRGVRPARPRVAVAPALGSRREAPGRGSGRAA